MEIETLEDRKRRSGRPRKRKESYSPEIKPDEKAKKKKTEKQKLSGRTLPNRPCDILPNGEPFCCSLCHSPFVVNPLAKGVKKTARSRHVPLPKTRVEKHTGREMLLCNACAQTFDRPKQRCPKVVKVPTEQEQQAYLQDAEEFTKSLREEYDDPLVERLFCPVSKKKLCGCLQKYIKSIDLSVCDGVENPVPELLALMKEAEQLRTEKAYVPRENIKKKKFIGLGNGHKKSRRYEEFVLEKRRLIKDNMRLCERATQRVLMYSNNFLHKKLKTENRPCRIERTRGKAALGKLPELHTLVDLHCCTDHCVMMALTHRKLLQDWRDRAKLGQMEARRVLAEMLTPAGAFHTNCYQFISMVTGCSLSTIGSVCGQMIDTHGIRDPPEHGMKRVWQEYYKQSKTTHSDIPTSENNATAESNYSQSEVRNTQEMMSEQRATIQTTATDSNIHHYELQRQHLERMQQEIAQKQQQLQQQQMTLQIHLLAQQVSNSGDHRQNTVLQQLLRQITSQQAGSTVSSTEVIPQTQPVKTSSSQPEIPPNHSVQSNVNQSSLSVNQLHPVILQQLQQQPALHQMNVNQQSGETLWTQPVQSVNNMTSLPVSVNGNQPNIISVTNQSRPPLPVTQNAGSNMQDFVYNPAPNIQQHQLRQVNQSHIVLNQAPQTVPVQLQQPNITANQPIQFQLIQNQGNQSKDENQSIQLENLIGQSNLQQIGQGKTQFQLNVVESQQVETDQSANVQIFSQLSGVNSLSYQDTSRKELQYQVSLTSSQNEENENELGKQDETGPALELSNFQNYQIELIPGDNSNTPSPVQNLSQDQLQYIMNSLQNVTILGQDGNEISMGQVNIVAPNLSSQSHAQSEFAQSSEVIPGTSEQYTDKTLQTHPALQHPVPAAADNGNQMRLTAPKSSSTITHQNLQQNVQPVQLILTNPESQSFNQRQSKYTTTAGSNNTLLPNSTASKSASISKPVYMVSSNDSFGIVTPNINVASVIANSSTNENEIMPRSVTMTPVSLPSMTASSLQHSDAGNPDTSAPPTQVQISFQTSVNEGDASSSSSQHIVLPHSSVLTIPIVPLYSSTAGDASITGSHMGGQSDVMTMQASDSGRHNDLMRQSGESVDKTRKLSASSARASHSSGNTARSRQSSGNSLRSGQSNRSRQSSGNSLSSESFRQFASKITNRSRQSSGNSLFGDRSRKSSGNSHFGETSVTLSNLSSPNLFLDKDRGIYFIPTAGENSEFCEITSCLNMDDDAHLSDFILNVGQGTDIESLSRFVKINQSTEIENLQIHSLESGHTNNHERVQQSHSENDLNIGQSLKVDQYGKGQTFVQSQKYAYVEPKSTRDTSNKGIGSDSSESSDDDGSCQTEVMCMMPSQTGNRPPAVVIPSHHNSRKTPVLNRILAQPVVSKSQSLQQGFVNSFGENNIMHDI